MFQFLPPLKWWVSLERYHEITHIVSGGARGADALGEKFAKEYVRDYYFVSDKKEEVLEYIGNMKRENSSFVRK